MSSTLDPKWRKTKEVENDEICRRFILERINPGVIDRDRDLKTFDRQWLHEAADLGILGYALPREVGGTGHDISEWGLFLERIGYHCLDNSFPLALGLFTAVARTLYQTGQPHLIEEYVKPMCRGEILGAFAYTDFADPFSFRTYAKQDGEEYVLNGMKPMVGAGMLADVFLVYVQGKDQDLMAFLVRRTDDGVEIKQPAVMGMRTLGLISMELTDVRLSQERIVVPSDGLSHIQRLLNNERRAVFPASILGRMQAVLEECIREAADTIRYQQPITEMKNVQAIIGRMSCAVETARIVLYHALDRLASKDQDPMALPSLLSSFHRFCADLETDRTEKCFDLYPANIIVPNNRMTILFLAFLGR